MFVCVFNQRITGSLATPMPRESLENIDKAKAVTIDTFLGKGKLTHYWCWKFVF